MFKVIQNLYAKKLTPQNDFPLKILKWDSDTTPVYVTKSLMKYIENANFCDELIIIDVIPVYMEKVCNENYRPVSVLLTWSKNVSDTYIWWNLKYSKQRIMTTPN